MATWLNVFILCFIVISGCKGFPLDEDDDAVVIEAENGIDDNIGDDDKIDLSHLGPEAYRAPSSESGKFYLFILPEEESIYHLFCGNCKILPGKKYPYLIISGIGQQVSIYMPSHP